MKKGVWMRRPDIDPNYRRTRLTGRRPNRESDVILRANVNERRHLSSYCSALNSEKTRNMRILNNHRQGFIASQQIKQKRLERAGLTHLFLLPIESENCSSTVGVDGYELQTDKEDRSNRSVSIALLSGRNMSTVELKSVSTSSFKTSEYPATSNTTKLRLPDDIVKSGSPTYVGQKYHNDIGNAEINFNSGVKKYTSEPLPNTLQTSYRNNEKMSEDKNNFLSLASKKDKALPSMSVNSQKFSSNRNRVHFHSASEESGKFAKELAKDPRFISLMTSLARPSYHFPPCDGKFLSSGRPSETFEFERIPTPEQNMAELMSWDSRLTSRVSLLSIGSRGAGRSISTAEVLQRTKSVT